MKTTHITHRDMTLDKMTDSEIRDGEWAEAQATAQMMAELADEFDIPSFSERG